MHDRPLVRAALCLALFPLCAHAQILSGQVLDATGQPVPNVDIDLENLGSGGDPDLMDDFTDVNGFFSFLVPPGFYDIRFVPPVPPTTTHLIATMEAVTIVGDLNVGQVTLPPGYGLTGRALGPTGLALPGVDLDITELATGEDLFLISDNTNAFGVFNIAVPQGPFELQLDATPVLGQTVVSQALELDLSGNTNLGDIVFPQGFFLSGRVVTPAGVGLANVDIDAVGSDGVDVYTPKDNTDALGFFQVVVPADTIDVEACPPTLSPFAGVAQTGVSVAGPTNIGTLTAPQGVILSGTVTDFTGALLAEGDVDLMLAGTQTSVFVCSDAVSGGSYSLKAPLGTFDVVFEPVDFSEPLGADVHAGVSLFADQTLNGQLPSCPFPTAYGAGSPGTGGVVPQLAGKGGAPRVDNPDFGWLVTGAVPSTVGGFFIGFSQTAIPFAGGSILVTPAPIVQFPLAANGAGEASLTLPVKPNYAGVTVHTQAWAIDFGTPFLVTLTNGVTTTFCE